MIVFNKLWVLMKGNGVSTYQLRENCGIDSKTIRRLKANENIEAKTLNKLYSAMDCKLGDIAEYTNTRQSSLEDCRVLFVTYSSGTAKASITAGSSLLTT